MTDDQPDLQPQPSTSSTIMRKLKQYKYITIAVALVIVGLFVGLMVGIGNNVTPPNKQDKASSYTSVLKQQQTITVGDKRYVAPCQALPASYVESNFGFSDITTIQEKILTTSIATSSRPAEAHCLYLLGSQKLSEIDVYTSQYSDTSELQRIGFVYFVVPEEVDSKINQLKSELGSNASQSSKDFVANLERSLADYKKYKREYRPDALKNFNPNGFVLPTGAREYTAIYNNVAYRVSMQYPKDATPSTATQIANWQKTFAELKKNANNKQLSQDPAPTLLRNKFTVGQTTKIVEPCAVLSGAEFKEITGIEQNGALSRRTVPYNVDKARYGTKDKQLILPANTCERTHTNESTESTNTINFEIKHASSIDQAKKWYTAFATGTGDVPLQTAADEAVQSVNEFDPDSPLYGFQVGPYVMILDIQTTTSGNGSSIEFTTASEEQHIKAINTLTARLKQQL